MKCIHVMRQQRGITLIELLVVLAIMGAVIAPIVAVTSYTLGTHQTVVHQNELQHEARFILEHMSNTIRQGASWDGASETLIYTQGARAGQPALSYDGGQFIYFGGDDSYVASRHVVQFQVIAHNEASYDVFLELANDRTGDQYEIRTTLIDRQIEYEFD